MINEIRTLLANRLPPYAMGSGSIAKPYAIREKYGDEYVDPTFKPVQESDAVATARAQLFGGSPDDLTVNYRLAQYMSLLRAERSVLPYLADFDRRETDTQHLGFWGSYPFGVEWTELVSPSSPIRVIGSFAGFDIPGHNVLVYKLHMFFAAEGAVLKVRSYRHQLYERTYSQYLGTPDEAWFKLPDPDNMFVIFSGLSSAAGHWVEVHDPENQWLNHWLETAEDASEAVWQVEVQSRPSRSLADIDAGLRDRGAYSASYGLPAIEPYLSLRNMMAFGDTLQVRVAATLLTVAHANKAALNA